MYIVDVVDANCGNECTTRPEPQYSVGRITEYDRRREMSW